MTLNYRGLKYDTNTVAVAERPVQRKSLVYRGVSLNPVSDASAKPPAHHALKYRGMSYAV